MTLLLHLLCIQIPCRLLICLSLAWHTWRGRRMIRERKRHFLNKIYTRFSLIYINSYSFFSSLVVNSMNVLLTLFLRPYLFSFFSPSSLETLLSSSFFFLPTVEVRTREKGVSSRHLTLLYFGFNSLDSSSILTFSYIFLSYSILSLLLTHGFHHETP